ncbi:hypothetical protein L1987_86414 [Smallanthus sonchifolius]|uniref:Uncharacterized protein n=1 Tax=Smallanthus sonchifolius TaxID=185202 RepID=A0ACB8XZE1_9ASTR|nr:hypothetical protein L1987_86414 [Smallanthus sonchifolius]
MADNDLKPNHSSSEDDEEDTSGSEDEHTSGTESDEVSDTDSGEKTLIAHSQTANKPQAPVISSSGTEESGSETDSDSDSTPKNPVVVSRNVKPISSKPIEREAGLNLDSKTAKKDGPKTISTPPPAKSKRPAPAANEKDAKKTKQITANVENKKPLVTPSQSAKKPQSPDLSSSEVEESDSGTDSDSPPKKSTAANPNIKPISSKPMEREKSKLELKFAKKDGSKAISTPPPVKSKPPPPPASAVSEKEAKRVTKVTKSSATDDDSKKLFQRLWSEDDEIVILEGMIDYITEKNGDKPIADMGAFYEYIKKSLHVDVSRAQLVDKVRRLKKKYVTNASREKDGKDRIFYKSHEQKGYELSKLIWGTESKKNQSQKNGKSKGTAASTITSTGTGTASAANLVKSNMVEDNEKPLMEVEKKMDVSRFVQYGGRSDSLIFPEEIVKAGMELVDGSRRAELEEKWRKLKEQELLLYVRRMELLKEQALLVLEAIGSSGN